MRRTFITIHYRGMRAYSVSLWRTLRKKTKKKTEKRTGKKKKNVKN